MNAFSLELYIHDTIYNGQGDEADVHVRVFAEKTGDFRYINYDAPEEARERTVHIDPKEARRFLKAAVQELEAPFWAEDLSDTGYADGPYLNVLPGFRPDFTDDDEEGEALTPEAADDHREPLWLLRLEMNTGAVMVWGRSKSSFKKCLSPLMMMSTSAMIAALRMG